MPIKSVPAPITSMMQIKNPDESDYLSLVHRLSSLTVQQINLYQSKVRIVPDEEKGQRLLKDIISKLQESIR